MPDDGSSTPPPAPPASCSQTPPQSPCTEIPGAISHSPGSSPSRSSIVPALPHRSIFSPAYEVPPASWTARRSHGPRQANVGARGRYQRTVPPPWVLNYTMRLAEVLPTQRRQLWLSSGVNFLRPPERQ